MKIKSPVLAVVTAFLFIQTFSAQAADDPNALGWHKTAKLGANLSLSSSQDVVGQTDGTSETYGLNLKSEFKRMGDWDEWRTEGSLIAATTKTPSISRFVKSNDELKLNTAYLRFLNDKKTWGPYVRAEAASPMFKGEHTQATAAAYQVTNTDKTSFTTGPLDSYRLTDGFKPLTTKESLGMFWKAVNEENLKVEARVGAAALQIAAAGQYTAKGKNTSGQVVVNELSDVNQLGVEAAVSVKGKVDEKSSYEAGVETLTPFVNNKASTDKREAFALTNVDGFVKLTSNITSWASFGYDYKVKLQPQLTKPAQQTHMIVINFNYNLL